MKRYDLFGRRNGYLVPVSESVQSHSGEWVPAEVAQALYDALMLVRDSTAVLNHLDIDHIDCIENALALADKTESNDEKA